MAEDLIDGDMGQEKIIKLVSSFSGAVLDNGVDIPDCGVRSPLRTHVYDIACLVTK